MSDCPPQGETPARPLSELAAGLAEVPSGLMVSDLTLDSRAVRPGGLFLACQGRTRHGLAFVQEAIARGAAAVLYEAAPGAGALLPPPSPGVIFAQVPELSRHLGELAARFFGHPAEHLHIAGVTGTSGKTTSAWLLAQALTTLGSPCAYLGTLGFGMPGQLAAGEHTTPDAISVQRHLAQAVDLKASHLAMEVSSHAIDQERIAATPIEVAAYTNLTREHLDYHGTMEAYGAAKARLFARAGLRHAVINADDPFGRTLVATLPPERLILTSRLPGDFPAGTRHVCAAQVEAASSGLVLEVESSWGRARLSSSLIGGFNAENLLTALGMLLALGAPLPEAARALGEASPASGRMERFGGEGGRPLAVVDYSHKPDALAKALRATREHCSGRVHVVFGCGGDRDAGKRRLMGAIAAELADELTLTDDNPRSEEPAHIIAQILEGVAHSARVHIEHDRELAIVDALRRAREGDAVLIAGKGHEDYQIHGSRRRSFSDQAVVRAAFGGASIMRRTLAELAHAVGGALRGEDRPYTGIGSDTRTLKPGEVFIALRGPRFNGNELTAAARAAGAVGAIVDTGQPVDLPQIVVADTQEALVRAARAWRQQVRIPVVGVAGSNGKTTTKEMLAAILSQAGSVLATRGNLNNHIGVPLTLLRLEPTHRFAVIEMGTNHPGELAHLVGSYTPDIGLITNAGAEHLEGFGSLEGVARAEGEMVGGLAPSGTAILNLDDEFFPLWKGLTKARVVTFGTRDGADFQARDIAMSLGGDGFLTRYTLVCPLGTAAVTLATGARHNVVNSLAAAAAAAAAGAQLAHIVAGLAAVRAVPGRLQVKQAAAGAAIIDDSYNANPSSMEAAIGVLAALAGPRWLVIGDMGEMGDHGPAAHSAIGRYARVHGIERLHATGPLSQLAVAAFGEGATWHPDTTALSLALLAALKEEPAAAAVRILVKGSRMNRLERVVEALVHGAPTTTTTDGH